MSNIPLPDLHTGPQDAGKRLDAFLHEQLPQFSRSRIQSWIRDGRVLLNSEPARCSYVLRGSETISVNPTHPLPLKAEPENLPLKILYEDADVMVVDKPAGMVVHAGAGHAHGTLVNAVLHHLAGREQLSSLGEPLRPGIVHRLDRDTSGVLLVARTDHAHQSLAAQFHSRSVEKIYLALAHRKMKQPQGRISAPISRDPVRRTRMTAKLASGRSAITDYRVIEQFEKFSFLEVRIKTGRTHQIRVHLSHVGHPIVGDHVYGAPALIPNLPVLNRFFLHAHRLRFHSPSSGELITVESPLPCELSGFLRAVAENTSKMKASK